MFQLRRRELFCREFFLGILAGFHYVHFIETYNHEKYNTQVFTPETLECYVGVFSSFILFTAYLVVAWYFESLFGNFGLLVLLIPILTNSISIFYGKRK